MAAVVIDRADNKVKILEITQKSIMKSISGLSANPDWGKPFSYDLTVNKTGEQLKTKYSVSPSPKKALDKSVIKDAQKTPCNLEALYEGENPWEVESGEETEYIFK